MKVKRFQFVYGATGFSWTPSNLFLTMRDAEEKRNKLQNNGFSCWEINEVFV
jgi:hypothetical protein